MTKAKYLGQNLGHAVLNPQKDWENKWLGTLDDGEACPGFPECHNTKPYYEKIGVACPKCGKDIIVRMSKKGRRYYGCMGNPECDFMVWQKPSSEKCPRCGGLMLEKGNRLVCADSECGFVKNRSESEE